MWLPPLSCRDSAVTSLEADDVGGLVSSLWCWWPGVVARERNAPSVIHPPCKLP